MFDVLVNLGNVKKNSKYRVACTFTFTFVLFALIYIFNDVVFFINDDTNIMYTLSGNYTNIPFDHPFINYFLSLFFRFFYTFLPNIPWYGFFHCFFIFVSIWIIIDSVLKKCFECDLNIKLSFLLILAMFLAFLLYPVILMQFTTTSALLGAASLCVLYNIDFRNHAVSKQYILSICLALLSYMYRKNSGLIVIAFFFLLVFFRVAELYLEKISLVSLKNIVIFYLKKISIFSLFFLIVFFGNIVFRSSEEWKTYNEFDKVRVRVNDYPHDYPHENPELFDEIGWNQGLRNLAGGKTWSFFFMDKKINEKTLKQIANTYKESDENVLDKVKRSLHSAWHLDEIAKITFILIPVIVLFCIIKYIYSTKYDIIKFNLIFTLFIFVSFLMCLFYLCINERIPLRAFQSIVLPVIPILIMQGIYFYSVEKNHKLLENIVIIILLLSNLFSIFHIYPNIRTLAFERQNKSKNTLLVEEYVLQNKDNFYVYDSSLTFRYDPFVTYSDSKPTNLMYWGGMGWKSPAYYYQLQLNGFDELYSDKLLLDNVYFITKEDFYLDDAHTSSFDIFNSYMKETYSGVSVEKVDSLGNNISVYKYTK